MSKPSTLHIARNLDQQPAGPVPPPGSGPQPRDLLRILVLLAALGIAFLGLFGGSLGLLLSWLQQEAGALSTATLSLSLLVLTAGLGFLLAWHTWSAIQDRPSAAFRPEKIGLLVLVFLLSLIFGQLVLSRDLLPRFAFPLLHVVATTLPALIILALVGRGLGAITSRRDIVFQLIGGAFLGAPLAFILEAVTLLSLLGATLLGLAARPRGQELLRFSSTYLQDPAQLQDLSLLESLFSSPAIVAAAMIFFAGIVPFIEEGVKTIGVGLMANRKPTLSQAFLWGLAGGAGFAIVEGLLNTTGGFTTWAPLVLVRIGTTLLHCITGAMMGVAWHSALVRKRWAPALGLYAACVAVHSLWNGLSIGMIFLSLGQPAAIPATGIGVLAGFGIVLMIGLLAILALVMAAALLALTLFIRRRARASQHPRLRPPLATAETVTLPGSPTATGHAEE
jgi:hypothetical protein